jgi:hypothetical protein
MQVRFEEGKGIMKRKAMKKPYWKMNSEELAHATKEFDEELVIEKCMPLSPRMRIRWKKAKRNSREERKR